MHRRGGSPLRSSSSSVLKGQVMGRQRVQRNRKGTGDPGLRHCTASSIQYTHKTSSILTEEKGPSGLKGGGLSPPFFSTLPSVVLLCMNAWLSLDRSPAAAGYATQGGKSSIRFQAPFIYCKGPFADHPRFPPFCNPSAGRRLPPFSQAESIFLFPALLLFLFQIRPLSFFALGKHEIIAPQLLTPDIGREGAT